MGRDSAATMGFKSTKESATLVSSPSPVCAAQPLNSICSRSLLKSIEGLKPPEASTVDYHQDPLAWSLLAPTVIFVPD
eukprot:scaffold484506_cov17-Prasinocladus_malaysianus.AAC.1